MFFFTPRGSAVAFRATISRHLMRTVFWWVDSYTGEILQKQQDLLQLQKREVFRHRKGQFPLGKRGGGRRRHKMVTTIWFVAKKSTQSFFVQSFSRTLRVMDVRAENRGRPQQKVRFSAAPVTGRNFLTPGHPGVRVRNVRKKFGPKSLSLCCFFFPDWCMFDSP